MLKSFQKTYLYLSFAVEDDVHAARDAADWAWNTLPHPVDCLDRPRLSCIPEGACLGSSGRVAGAGIPLGRRVWSAWVGNLRWWRRRRGWCGCRERCWPGRPGSAVRGLPGGWAEKK